MDLGITTPGKCLTAHLLIKNYCQVKLWYLEDRPTRLWPYFIPRNKPPRFLQNSPQKIERLSISLRKKQISPNRSDCLLWKCWKLAQRLSQKISESSWRKEKGRNGTAKAVGVTKKRRNCLFGNCRNLIKKIECSNECCYLVRVEGRKRRRECRAERVLQENSWKNIKNYIKVWRKQICWRTWPNCNCNQNLQKSSWYKAGL